MLRARIASMSLSNLSPIPSFETQLSKPLLIVAKEYSTRVPIGIRGKQRLQCEGISKELGRSHQHINPRERSRHNNNSNNNKSLHPLWAFHQPCWDTHIHYHFTPLSPHRSFIIKTKNAYFASAYLSTLTLSTIGQQQQQQQ